MEHEPDQIGIEHAITFPAASELATTVSAIANEKFREAFSIFQGNVHRISVMASGLPLACGLSMFSGMVTGQVLENKEFTSPEYKQALIDAESNWLKNIKIKVAGDAEKTLFTKGIRHLQTFAELYKGLDIGIRAILSSQLVYAWSAFEALTEDLWRHAVNQRPKTLAKYVISGNKPVEGASSKEPPPSLSFKSLEDFDFDISGRIGEFLVKNEYVMFNNFANTERAYKATFRISEDKQRRPSNVLCQIFDSCRQELKLLERIRNLYAHQSGRVDRQFLDDVIGSEFDDLKPGAEFPINGQIISRFVNAMIEAGTNIAKFADKWLQDKIE